MRPGGGPRPWVRWPAEQLPFGQVVVEVRGEQSHQSSALSLQSLEDSSNRFWLMTEDCGLRTQSNSVPCDESRSTPKWVYALSVATRPRGVRWR